MGVEAGPFLIFKVEGAYVDVVAGTYIDSGTEGIHLEIVGGMRGGVELGVEGSDSEEHLRIRVETFFVEDHARSEQVGVLADVGGCKDAGVMDVTFNADVLGKVEGAVDGGSLDTDVAVDGLGVGSSDADLQGTAAGCRGHGLGVGEDGKSE